MLIIDSCAVYGGELKRTSWRYDRPFSDRNHISKSCFIYCEFWKQTGVSLWLYLQYGHVLFQHIKQLFTIRYSWRAQKSSNKYKTNSRMLKMTIPSRFQISISTNLVDVSSILIRFVVSTPKILVNTDPPHRIEHCKLIETTSSTSLHSQLSSQNYRWYHHIPKKTYPQLYPMIFQPISHISTNNLYPNIISKKKSNNILDSSYPQILVIIITHIYHILPLSPPSPTKGTKGRLQSSRPCHGVEDLQRQRPQVGHAAKVDGSLVKRSSRLAPGQWCERGNVWLIYGYNDVCNVWLWICGNVMYGHTDVNIW